MSDDDAAQYPRFKKNKNIRLITNNVYKGFKLIEGKGPLVKEWLDTTLSTIGKGLEEHSCLTCIRFDLRFPDHVPYMDDDYVTGIMDRFVASLKAKLRHDRQQAAKQYKRVHDTSVRYTWAREYGKKKKVHFHFLLLLNGNAYRELGFLNADGDNMASRIDEAWTTALRDPIGESAHLVYFPDNAVYHVNNNTADIGRLFYRASYLCKIATKWFGNGTHPFGCSRH